MAEQQNEVFRAIGKLEAAASMVTNAIESLTKGVLESKLQGERIETKLNAMATDMGGTDATAKAALSEAGRAHGRIDKVIYTASGFGAAGGILGWVVSTLLNAWQYLPKIIGH